MAKPTKEAQAASLERLKAGLATSQAVNALLSVHASVMRSEKLKDHAAVKSSSGSSNGVTEPSA